MQKKVIPIEQILSSPVEPGRIVSRLPDRTWGELLTAAGGYAARLPENDRRPWVVVFDSGFEFLAALFACWTRGIVPVVTPDSLPGTIAQLDGEIAGVMTDHSGTGSVVLSPGSDAGGGMENQTFPETSAALELFTSGSSGKRKRLAKTFRQLNAEVRTLQQMWTESEDSCSVATVSHQHIYGLLFRILWPVCRGAAFVDRTIFHWEEIFAIAEQHPVSVISSPVHLRHLALMDDDRVKVLTGSRVFSSGGPLEAGAALKIAARLGRAPTEVLGSTETGGIACRERTPGSDPGWRVFPGIDHAIEKGRLTIRSPYLPSATGWYETDDRAAPLPDGTFRLLGRADRIVKVFEKRISLDDMERALAGSGLVSEARAFMIPSGRKNGSERIGMIVLLAPEGRSALHTTGRKGLIQTLKAGMRALFDIAVLPRFWRFVAHFPQDTQGKLNKEMVNNLFRLKPEGHTMAPIELGRKKTSGGALLQLRVPNDLVFLQGHFPQFPLVPGVCQIRWVLAEIRRQIPNEFVTLRRMESVKFHSLLKPGVDFRLRLDQHATTGQWTFRLFDDDTKYSSGRLFVST